MSLGSTLYPVCVAHAHDRMPADRVAAVSGRLILVSGLGSVVGPLIGTSLVLRFNIDGVFYLMAAAAFLSAFLAAGRSMTTASPQHWSRMSPIRETIESRTIRERNRLHRANPVGQYPGANGEQ
jgi:MFS family permease